MFGAFGSGGFGSLSFGGALGGTSIGVRIRALNALDVTIDGAIAISPAIEGDPLNIRSWSLSLHPGQVGAVPLVQDVQKLGSSAVTVYFDGPMTQNVVYDFVYVSAADPSFLMRILTPAQSEAAKGRPPQGRYDLSNPNLLADSQGNVVALGTLQVTESGDFAIETGAKYLRKRIIRRLTTASGSFLFLPNYGLAIPLKRLLRPSELRRFQAEAVRQVRAEVDVAAASVTVSQPAEGALEVFVKIRTVQGFKDEFGTRINAAGNGV